MKKLLSRRLICVFLITAAVLAVYGIFLLISGDEFNIYVNYTTGSVCEKVEVRFGEKADRTESDFFTVESITKNDGYAHVVISSEDKGQERVIVTAVTDAGTDAYIAQLNSGVFGIISNNFDRHIYFVLSSLSVLLAAYFIYCFGDSVKKRRFSYDGVFYLSLTLLLGLLTVIWCAALIFSFARYHTTTSTVVYDLNRNLMTAVTVFTLPLTLLYAVSVSVSNIVLMHREGFRPANALGIISSIAMAAGLGAIAVLMYLSGERISTVIDAAYCITSSLYVFFEAVLISTVIYGIYVSRAGCTFDRDYIIILGCKIRADGTLYPLLRGRADRAIGFWKEQKEKTGKEAIFIPSGGQGTDEVMPEGEAIKNYLLSQGIPDRLIIPETKSTTTRENMRFSKEIIDSETENAKVLFSTTGYHVFRSGAIAYYSGINIDGIGSKTKWYFWPNAFLRETAGIFLSQPKKQLFITALIALSAGVGSYLYSLM